MGLGESREAAYRLRAPIRAGTWHLVGDGEGIYAATEVRFEIIWRAGGSNSVVATTTHTFMPLAPPNQYNAVPFDADLDGVVVPAAPGDLLILRFSTIGGASYIPNGDGALTKGRIPNLTLP